LLAAAAASFTALTCDDSQPIAPLADKVAEAFCAHQFECCSPFELSTLTQDRYTTEDECIPFATIAAREQLGAVQASLLQGRITVDAAALDACVKAYRDSACAMSTGYVYTPLGPTPSVLVILASCPDVFVGHVPDNAACDLPQECQRGSSCSNGRNPGNYGVAGSSGNVSLTPAPGVCLPYQKAGEPCNTTFDCDPTAHLACHNFACSPPSQEGEPCQIQIDALTGQATSNCDASRNLLCDNMISNTCRHLPREGELCSFFGTAPCDPDPALALSCNQITATCKRAGSEGEACGGPAIAPCRANLSCHATQPDGIGVCGAAPGLDERCLDRCASPNVCASGYCVAPGPSPLGSACTSNSDCASLNCMGFVGSSTCSPPLIQPLCVGAAVTPGQVKGSGGTGGIGGSMVGAGGFGGRSPPPGGRGGSAGAIGTAGTGVGGASGAGGAAGMPALGCQFSDSAPEDPIIADFNTVDLVPIGGIYTYAAPSSGSGPTATIEKGALHVTATTTGMLDWQFWGAGIYFNGNADGTDCVDGTGHVGVQFDVSGVIDGPGCTAQYSTNDSAHSDALLDPKGSGQPGVFAPQAPFKVTATPMTLSMPFSGPGAPTGGNPATSIDKSRLTGVQWQFTTPNDPTSSCNVDITIDNVRFF
jgi:hypothetical protein